MWVSGSLIRSSTWRSSSVSAPCISSSMSLPSSADRSRTMRGSFCQALPIGCMRVFITPSCSSAVTLESRCSGTLNSESSCRRTMSSSWLRVSTSSETMVIRCSSVSTLTRIDWLATLASALVVVAVGFASALRAWRLGSALRPAAPAPGPAFRGRRARARRARLRPGAAAVPASAAPACRRCAGAALRRVASAAPCCSSWRDQIGRRRPPARAGAARARREFP